jgi:hypothetical protein
MVNYNCRFCFKPMKAFDQDTYQPNHACINRECLGYDVRLEDEDLAKVGTCDNCHAMGNKDYECYQEKGGFCHYWEPKK